MATFSFGILETVVLERIYVVEADTAEKASEKAGRGETLSEVDIKWRSVLNREIISGPAPCDS